MSLRASFLPLRPEFDNFLFATVGDEVAGMPLSVISALTRLGLDPWQEAGRLSSLSHREAVEQLARLIAELPGGSRQRDEAQKIAGGLIGLLPTRERNRSLSQIQIRRRRQIRPRFRLPRLPGSSQLWVVCLVLAAAVVMSAILHGGLPFGIGSL
jgi:hypothetical protein